MGASKLTTDGVWGTLKSHHARPLPGDSKGWKVTAILILREMGDSYGHAE